MKVGIIRCQLTEEHCPGTTDFKIAAAGKGVFEEFGPVEIVGFVSCGGCCGKRAVARSQMLVSKGAEAVVFASCMSKGNPYGMPCPFFENIRNAVSAKVGEEIKILDWTH